MIEKDILERNFSFWSIEGYQIYACINECLIGWGKEREPPCTLEGR